MNTNYKYSQELNTLDAIEGTAFTKTDAEYRQEVNRWFIYIMIRALERFAVDKEVIGDKYD